MKLIFSRRFYPFLILDQGVLFLYWQIAFPLSSSILAWATPNFLCRIFPARAEGPFPRNQRRWFFIGHSGASTEISMFSSDPARLCGGKLGNLTQCFARHDPSIMALQPGRKHKTGGGQASTPFNGCPPLLLDKGFKFFQKINTKKSNKYVFYT